MAPYKPIWGQQLKPTFDYTRERILGEGDLAKFGRAVQDALISACRGYEKYKPRCWDAVHGEYERWKTTIDAELAKEEECAKTRQSLPMADGVAEIVGEAERASEQLSRLFLNPISPEELRGDLRLEKLLKLTVQVFVDAAEVVALWRGKNDAGSYQSYQVTLKEAANLLSTQKERCASVPGLNGDLDAQLKRAARDVDRPEFGPVKRELAIERLAREALPALLAIQSAAVKNTSCEEWHTEDETTLRIVSSLLHEEVQTLVWRAPRLEGDFVGDLTAVDQIRAALAPISKEFKATLESYHLEVKTDFEKLELNLPSSSGANCAELSAIVPEAERLSARIVEHLTAAKRSNSDGMVWTCHDYSPKMLAFREAGELFALVSVALKLHRRRLGRHTVHHLLQRAHDSLPGPTYSLTAAVLGKINDGLREFAGSTELADENQQRALEQFKFQLNFVYVAADSGRDLEKRAFVKNMTWIADCMIHKHTEQESLAPHHSRFFPRDRREFATRW